MVRSPFFSMPSLVIRTSLTGKYRVSSYSGLRVFRSTRVCCEVWSHVTVTYGSAVPSSSPGLSPWQRMMLTARYVEPFISVTTSPNCAYLGSVRSSRPPKTEPAGTCLAVASGRNLFVGAS